MHSATVSTSVASPSATIALRARRPRLLFVGAYPPLSIGTRAVSECIAERLRSSGWSVNLTSRQRLRALRVLDLHATVWRLRAKYDVAHVDVFSGSAFRWAEGATTLLKRIGKPFVLTLHGGNLPAFAAAQPGRVARLLAGAARITAPSAYLLDALCRDHPRRTVIPNPLEITKYRYTHRAQPAPRLLWLRAFHTIYDPSTALAVVRRLAEDVPELHLTMVGPDKDGSLAQIRTGVQAHSLEGHVRLFAAIPKEAVPRMLESADIFLNTATIDNSPVSVLEAMAAGLAIVSTKVGGLTHLLTHEHNALLVPPGDADAMAAAVRRVLREPGLGAVLSRNARVTADKHAWQHVLPLWEELLTHVVPSGAVVE